MNNIKAGFSLLEVTIAMAIFAIFVGIAAEAMTSGSTTATNMTKHLERTRDVEEVLQVLKYDIRGADPEFNFTDLTTKVIFSYRIASPEADFDLKGRVIYDVGYLCTYDHLTKMLKIESFYLTGPSGVAYRPEINLHVDRFAIYYHRWYKSLQVAIDGRLITAHMRNPHQPNTPNGGLDPTQSPFVPIDFTWRNDPSIDLPLVADMKLREAEDGI